MRLKKSAIKSQKEPLIADIVLGHEGLEPWFKYIVEYSVEVVPRRQYFFLYYMRRWMANTYPAIKLPLSKIRKEFQKLEPLGIRFFGTYGQRAFIPTHVRHYWRDVFLPSCQDESGHLMQFATIMNRMSRCRIKADPSFAKYLPAQEKSFRKKNLVMKILEGVFSSEKSYQEYRKSALELFPESDRRILEGVINSKNHQMAMNIFPLLTPESAKKVIETLLLRPYCKNGVLWIKGYEANHNCIELKITYQKDAGIGLSKCLSKAFTLLKNVLTWKKKKPDMPRKPITFPELAIWQACRKRRLFVELRELLIWWFDVIGFSIVHNWKSVLEPGIYKAKDGIQRVLLVRKEKIQELMKFGIQHKIFHEDNDTVNLTGLGGMIVDKRSVQQPEVEYVWGRNVNALTIKLGKEWPKPARDILLKVSKFDEDRYRVTPETIKASMADRSTIVFLLSGFRKIKRRQLARLSAWVAKENG